MQTQNPKVRYQALGPLMSGEGSRAFLGLEISDSSPARPVVMVWVPGDTARDAEKRAQILRETQRAVTLEHPNITRVYGLAALDEGLARVVEFADGESLRRVLEVVQRLPAQYAALVVADAATGLHFAHVAGNDDGSPLVHGDVRPETIMVTYGGVAKVAGYGALSVAPKEVDGKRVKRRRLYCAPEQIIGGRGAISVQTDVYLLGLALYECLTGRIPFEAEENFDQAVLEKTLSFDNVPEIPAALVPILVRATAKRASERFPTALAMRDEIEKAMGGLPTHQGFSGYLQAFFPDEEPARVARRQTIDAGLADHARTVWEKKAETPSIAPPAAPVPAPTNGVAKTNGATSATTTSSTSIPATRPRPTPLQVAAFKDRRRNLTPMWVVALLIFMVVGVWLGSRLGRQDSVASSAAAVAPPVSVTPPKSLESTTPPPNSTSTASAATPNTATASGGKTETAATPGTTPTTTAATPAAASTPETTSTTPKAAAASQLDLQVNPPVSVFLGGKSLGRTPLTVSLPPGRHMLRLVDNELGINLARPVNVARGTTTRHFVELGKGLLTVHVPSGAVIYLDGKMVGNQSVRDLSVYEGNHKLVVTMGTAKWQQAFTLGKDQTMEYEVQAEQTH